MKSGDKSVNIYAPTLHLDKESSATELRNRWKEGDLALLVAKIRQALISGSDFPSGTSYIYAEFSGEKLKLADFRGLDLSQTNFDKSDLSYCCFDFANFDNSTFNRANIQYSTFSHATLRRTMWVGVQASPIYANEINVEESKICASYMMASNLHGMRAKKSSILKTAFVGSDLTNLVLTAEQQFDANDVTGAILSERNKLILTNSVDAFGRRSIKMEPFDVAWAQINNKVASQIRRQKKSTLSKIREFNKLAEDQYLRERVRAIYNRQSSIKESYTGVVLEVRKGKSVTIIGKSESQFRKNWPLKIITVNCNASKDLNRGDAVTVTGKNKFLSNSKQHFHTKNLKTKDHLMPYSRILVEKIDDSDDNFLFVNVGVG